MTPKVFGFAGWSGSGKTTLIERVISHLAGSGVRVSLIKHAHHDFDVDQPGKDSYRHRAAGASEVLVSSANRWALMHELRGEPELTLRQAIALFGACDVVLVEGYKRESIPKLEVWRAEVGKALLFPGDANIVALASNDLLPSDVREPSFARFGLADVAEIAEFVMHHSCAV
ncbi:MAG: molybdopterin-guanine dinucleotide biosynthesis protein B [Rhizobacter sp.]|nr:molybdopterin-guanine dinucleotide biosynthesis protein B [Burkholderiales bacterium]